MSQFYSLQGPMFVSGIFCDVKDIEALDKMKREYEPEHFQQSHWLKVFPEAKSTVKNLIKKYNEDLDDLVKIKREIESLLYKSYPRQNEYDFASLIYLGIFYDIPKERIERKLKTLGSQLIAVSYPDKNPQMDLLKAKQFPIDSFLGKISGGFTQCVFHNEKTPSMKVSFNENRVHCFSCGFHGDVLDLVMKLEGITLWQAIKKLS